MADVIHGKVLLNAVHCVSERAAKHGRVQYQDVEWEVLFLERLGKALHAV